MSKYLVTVSYDFGTPNTDPSELETFEIEAKDEDEAEMKAEHVVGKRIAWHVEAQK